MYVCIYVRIYEYMLFCVSVCLQSVGVVPWLKLMSNMYLSLNYQNLQASNYKDSSISDLILPAINLKEWDGILPVDLISRWVEQKTFGLLTRCLQCKCYHHINTNTLAYTKQSIHVYIHCTEDECVCNVYLEPNKTLCSIVKPYF